MACFCTPVLLVNTIETNKVNHIHLRRCITCAACKSYQGITNVRYLEQFYFIKHIKFCRFYNSAGKGRKYFDDFLAQLRAPS